jgi:hypothetical protein
VTTFNLVPRPHPHLQPHTTKHNTLSLQRNTTTSPHTFPLCRWARGYANDKCAVSTTDKVHAFLVQTFFFLFSWVVGLSARVTAALTGWKLN